jgi:hypothetical protein
MRTTMRRAGWLLALALAGCGPKVNVEPSPYEYDDPSAGEPIEQKQTFQRYEERVEAPKGKGLRAGVVDRTVLLAVLDAGPGSYLRQFEVTGAMDGDRFVGWQLVQLVDASSPLNDLDLAAGDVLIALNGAPLSRPDQLMAVWDSLRTADAITADLLRGDARFSITFAVEPPVGRVPPDLVPATPAPAPATAAPTPAPTAPTAPATLKKK